MASSPLGLNVKHNIPFDLKLRACESTVLHAAEWISRGAFKAKNQTHIRSSECKRGKQVHPTFCCSFWDHGHILEKPGQSVVRLVPLTLTLQGHQQASYKILLIFFFYESNWKNVNIVVSNIMLAKKQVTNLFEPGKVEMYSALFHNTKILNHSYTSLVHKRAPDLMNHIKRSGTKTCQNTFFSGSRCISNT